MGTTPMWVLCGETKSTSSLKINVLQNIKQDLEIGIRKRGCEDNIKTNLKQIGCEFILVV
jgi:hypothetical protein